MKEEVKRRLGRSGEEERKERGEEGRRMENEGVGKRE